jgi:hypothetical protein
MNRYLLPLLIVLAGTAQAQSRYPGRGVSVGLDVFQLARGLNPAPNRQFRFEPYLRVPLRTDRLALVGSAGYNEFRRNRFGDDNHTTGWYAKAGAEVLPGRFAFGLSGLLSRYRQKVNFAQENEFSGETLRFDLPPRHNTTLGLEVTALHRVSLGNRLYFRWGVAGVAYTNPLRADPLPYTHLPGIGRDAPSWGHRERRIQTRFLIQLFYQFPTRARQPDSSPTP